MVEIAIRWRLLCSSSKSCLLLWGATLIGCVEPDRIALNNGGFAKASVQGAVGKSVLALGTVICTVDGKLRLVPAYRRSLTCVD